MQVEFISIPFSHYCEKARWCLDIAGVSYQEQGHLPIFSRRVTKKLGAGNTVPVLRVDGANVADSTAIAAWADRQRPGSILPTAPEQLRDALALEELFDTQLGPATRRWAYYHLLPNKELLVTLTKPGVPSWEHRAFRWFRPLAAAAIKRGLKIDAAGAQRSTEKIDATFDRVDSLLADGRSFLVGDKLSIADVAFASLSAPVLMPAQQPFGLPGPHVFPDLPQLSIRTWRSRPAGQFALGLYATHRA
jgi:glutathione S-transferase